MNSFKKELDKKTIEYSTNNFTEDNYDEMRFGPKTNFYRAPKGFYVDLKNNLKKLIGYKGNVNYVNISNDLAEKLNRMYESFNDQDKALLVDLILYRNLGFEKVKLPRNNAEYWAAIKKAEELADPNDTYNPNFLHFILNKFDLKSIGYNIQLYFSTLGIGIDYIIEQYAYKYKGQKTVSAEKGDVVLDIGACWGDTALYFAHHVGEKGMVHSFEFIPGNIDLFKKNMAFNPEFSGRINLVQHPVSDVSSQKIYYKDFGPGSEVVSHPFEGQTGSTTTLCIDDFVKQNNIEKVDFIKMDIEGAEPYALKGAIETIKKFKPKLAIATYHSMGDFVNIPNWILDLNLGYKIYLGHYTIHEEETICFASVK